MLYLQALIKSKNNAGNKVLRYENEPLFLASVFLVFAGLLGICTKLYDDDFLRL